MPTYLDRYLAGEYEQVWDELMALGAAVRDEPLYTDALAVARETMRRARYNVETIVARLRVTGYLFDQPEEAHKLPAADDNMGERLEQKYGPMPVSIRTWYEVVGEVDLIGTHPDWKVRGWDGGDERSPQWEKLWSQLSEAVFWSKKLIATDPLQVTSCGSYINGKLFIADDFAWKSGFSGAEVMISVPNPAADCLLEECYPNNETFVQYLRRSFRWGGFPGFTNVDENLRPTEMLAELTEGLLPI